MKTVAFVSLKGGVGKTISAVNLAAGLARAGRRVLLLDADSYNTSASNTFATDGANLCDVLSGAAPIASALREVRPGLHFIPGSRNLGGADINTDRLWLRLGLALEMLPAKTMEFCVIDAPAGWHRPTLQAAALAHLVIVPVAASLESLESAHWTRQRVEAVATVQRRRVRYLLTMARKTQQSQAVADENAPWLKSIIPATEAVKNLAWQSATVWDAPAGPARKAYAELAAEILSLRL